MMRGLQWLLIGIVWSIGLILQATSLEGKCQRIVSTSPSITNILTDLDLTPNIIGASRYCLLPENHEALQVGGYFDLNFEALISLRPSLVIMQGNKEQRDIIRLKELGIEVGTLSLDSLDNIFKSYQVIGDLCNQAFNVDIQQTLETLTRINEKNSTKVPQRILIFYGELEDYNKKIPSRVAGKSFHSELLLAIGGENVYQGSLNAPLLSAEAIYRLNPDKIIIFKRNDEPTFETRYQVETRILEVNWPLLEKVSAVKNGKIFEIEGAATVLPSPLAIKVLAEALERVLDQ